MHQVDKEWCSMGHPFQANCGVAGPAFEPRNAPFFLMWLDVVYQIMVQFPHSEYHEHSP